MRLGLVLLLLLGGCATGRPPTGPMLGGLRRPPPAPAAPAAESTVKP
jgi:hypothetical protein